MFYVSIYIKYQKKKKGQVKFWCYLWVGGWVETGQEGTGRASEGPVRFSCFVVMADTRVCPLCDHPLSCTLCCMTFALCVYALIDRVDAAGGRWLRGSAPSLGERRGLTPLPVSLGLPSCVSRRLSRSGW